MNIVSRFAESDKLFFAADDGTLSDSDLNVIEQNYNGNDYELHIKAFLLKGLMLHYTYYVFNSPQKFLLTLDEDIILNTFYLKSNCAIEGSNYEPYLLCDEEFISVQLIPQGIKEFGTPLVVELFRIFTTTNWYLEILGNYGDTFKKIIQKIDKKEDGNIFPSDFHISPRMKVTIKEILDYKNSNKNLCRNFYRNKTLELIHLQLEQLLTHGEEDTSSKLSQTDVQKIHEAGKILEVNYNNPPTIKQLSLLLATNENKLKSGFSSIFNTSIYQYVLKIRIEKSVELMNDRDLSIEQISNMIGYVNLSHFTRAFKKIKGVPPGKFRSSM